MKVSEVVAFLEHWAPPSFQESYDNSGLLVGERHMEVRGIAVCLDVTEAVIEDAIANSCNLIVTHHPIIFGGLKKLTGANYVERTVMLALRSNVAIYAIHTNLDHVKTGVNAEIASRLGLQNTSILQPLKETLNKLITFVPESHAEAVRSALFDSGAGSIGAYDNCSFNTSGTGTFRAGVGTDPFVGKQGEVHYESEVRVEVLVPQHLTGAVISAMKNAHPYEEVAYDVIKLQNERADVGAGMIGTLSAELSPDEFLALVKANLHVPVIRYTPVNKSIKKVAVCGGAGSFLLKTAIRAGADAFVTGDFKYHQFFDAEESILIADTGHFENEQFTIDLITRELKEKFPTFAIRKTEISTNPILYYT
jgi:dinuclear metal center YbgI/SA1388 family protein